MHRLLLSKVVAYDFPRMIVHARVLVMLELLYVLDRTTFFDHVRKEILLVRHLGKLQRGVAKRRQCADPVNQTRGI